MTQQDSPYSPRPAGDSLYHATGSLQSARPSAHRPLFLLTALIAALLLASFALQLPTPRVADWAQFAFYDPGTVLKGDWLIAKGYVPTIDFGYTHGLLSLVFARVGFALLGRTPAAFLIITLLLEMVMAWALARLLLALNLRHSSLLIFLAGLPMAIMPAYLTLTHPLEATLILLALADQARAKHARALALMTLCLFVKPSMAYVYGFVLLLLIITRSTAWQCGASSTNTRLLAIFRALTPAAATLVLLFAALSSWFGIGPVLHTLLPLTGVKTYALTGFGFFAPQGRDFWMLANPWGYLFTPVGVFLLASIVAAAGALGVLLAKKRTRGTPPPPTCELLLTIGILHTAFLLGFYGWTGSWAYYSYLPVLALALAVDMFLPGTVARQWVAALLVTLLLLSESTLVGSALVDWHWKERTASGLWAYPDQLAEWNRIVAMVETQNNETHRRTLLMTNGWLAGLPENFALPDAWFPEPGIPTAREIARVKGQAGAADYVILWQQYGSFDLWNSAEFAGERGAFHTIFTGKYMILLQRFSTAR